MCRALRGVDGSELTWRFKVQDLKTPSSEWTLLFGELLTVDLQFLAQIFGELWLLAQSFKPFKIMKFTIQNHEV